MLLLPLADRQHVIERNAHFALPEGEHLFEIVGAEPDIDARLGKVHGDTRMTPGHPTIVIPGELERFSVRVREGDPEVPRRHKMPGFPSPRFARPGMTN